MIESLSTTPSHIVFRGLRYYNNHAVGKAYTDATPELFYSFQDTVSHDRTETAIEIIDSYFVNNTFNTFNDQNVDTFEIDDSFLGVIFF